MRSAASIKGHPIHPMLITFPFAFLSGAFVFDLLGALTGRAPWWTTGGYLAIAGLVGGVAAAVPGLADYLATVPPRSSAKSRATTHMIVNSTALLLFLLVWIRRGEAANQPDVVQLMIEGIALGLLCVGGWMGGTLVSRNQISVDHRYAHAGRWREKTVVLEPGKPGLVARADELKEDQMTLLRTGRGHQHRIVLGRTDKGYVAFDDRCSHTGGSLAGGVMVCGTVQCPWHGSQFDCASGAVLAGPASTAIKAHKVEQRGDEIYLTL